MQADDPDSEALLWKLQRELNGLRGDGAGRPRLHGPSGDGARRGRAKLQSGSPERDSHRGRDGSDDEQVLTSTRIKEEVHSGVGGRLRQFRPAWRRMRIACSCIIVRPAMRPPLSMPYMPTAYGAEEDSGGPARKRQRPGGKGTGRAARRSGDDGSSHDSEGPPHHAMRQLVAAGKQQGLQRQRKLPPPAAAAEAACTIVRQRLKQHADSKGSEWGARGLAAQQYAQVDHKACAHAACPTITPSCPASGIACCNPADNHLSWRPLHPAAAPSSVKVFHAGVRWGVALPRKALSSRLELARALNDALAGHIASAGRGDGLTITFLNKRGLATELGPSCLLGAGGESAAQWRALASKCVRVYVRPAGLAMVGASAPQVGP